MTSKPLINVGPLLKKKRWNNDTGNGKLCILCKETCTEQHFYTDKQWNNLMSKAKEWSGLDIFGSVYTDVDWTKGSQDEQSIFHRKCTKSMQTKSKLLQAISRCNNKKDTLDHSTNDKVPLSSTSSSIPKITCDSLLAPQNKTET